MSNITIPSQRGETLETYLFNRFIERFGTDDEINTYISTGVFSGRDTYSERVLLCEDGVISVEDYSKFLERVIDNLPSKFTKKKAKKLLALIDLYIGPKTFESAKIEKSAREMVKPLPTKDKDEPK